MQHHSYNGSFKAYKGSGHSNALNPPAPPVTPSFKATSLKWPIKLFDLISYHSAGAERVCSSDTPALLPPQDLSLAVPLTRTLFLRYLQGALTLSLCCSKITLSTCSSTASLLVCLPPLLHCSPSYSPSDTLGIMLAYHLFFILECKLHKGRGFYLFCSWLCPLRAVPGTRQTINIC